VLGSLTPSQLGGLHEGCPNQVTDVLNLCSNLGVQVLPDKMQSVMQFECKCPEYRTRGLG